MAANRRLVLAKMAIVLLKTTRGPVHLWCCRQSLLQELPIRAHKDTYALGVLQMPATLSYASEHSRCGTVADAVTHCPQGMCALQGGFHPEVAAVLLNTCSKCSHG